MDEVGVGILIALVVSIALGVLGLGIVTYLVWTIISMAWDGFRFYSNRKDYPDKETLLGTFSFKYDNPNGSWVTYGSFGEHEVQVILDDVEGEPDPKLLQYLLQNRDKLDEVAESIRPFVDGLEERHTFGMVCSSEHGEVCLGFSSDDEHWGETVFVDLTDGEVVASVTVD